ncbi:MAG: GNAT family N-acetyltransferase [Pseudomonadales bacterium]|nr:GNAT family N-acetyltransferase [Pseudomonadales bacterium]
MPRLASVGIRRADVSDLPSLRRVETGALAAIHDLYQGRDDWQSLFDDGTVFTYLAEDDAPFGFVTAGRPREEWFHNGSMGEIISLCVLPDYQGHGIGRHLLVHGMSVLKRRDFESALVWLREESERGRKLIEALGFEEIDACRTLNVAGNEIAEQAWCMSLDEFF